LRTRTPLAAGNALLLPNDAERVDYVGYWGDWVKKDDDKHQTEVGSERVSLTISPKSNFVRGQVVEGKNRFLVLGVRAQSPNKRRDEFALSFIGQPKDEVDDRTEDERNSEAPTTGSYILRKFDDSSYTGVAVYWDKCNQVWVQCPYALERGGKVEDDPEGYAKDRWPTRFNLDKDENQCHPAILKQVDQTIAKTETPSKGCS
jgi:hypothetical protein